MAKKKNPYAAGARALAALEVLEEKLVAELDQKASNMTIKLDDVISIHNQRIKNKFAAESYAGQKIRKGRIPAAPKGSPEYILKNNKRQEQRLATRAKKMSLMTEEEFLAYHKKMHSRRENWWGEGLEILTRMGKGEFYRQCDFNGIVRLPHQTMLMLLRRGVARLAPEAPPIVTIYKQTGPWPDIKRTLQCPQYTITETGLRFLAAIESEEITVKVREE